MRHHIYLLKDLDQDSIGLDFYNAMAHLFLHKLEQGFDYTGLLTLPFLLNGYQATDRHFLH